MSLKYEPALEPLHISENIRRWCYAGLLLPASSVSLLMQALAGPGAYRGTSLIRNSRRLGPYSRTKPRALWWSQGGSSFLLSEVPL